MCPPIEPMSALMIERVIFMKFSVGYDVAAGRQHVEAYVPYVHYVERLWEAAAGSKAPGHYAEHGVNVHQRIAHVP